MTDEQLAKIKEAAEKATHRWNETDVFIGGNPHVIEMQFDFVNACDPVSVLSLIARLEAAEARATTAYNEGIEAAAVKSDHYAIKAQYRAASHDNPVARNAAWGKNEAGREIAIEIRALKKPATDEAEGKSGE